MKSKIDFVLLWVDCNDKNWQKIYSDFTGKKIVHDQNRYRDWGMLKYWFRAVEKYAPWVDNIYFITCGQKPDFLNVNNPKIKIIDHEDYISKEYLPTFNSNVIEMNLFKIKELSERFVLFNDDMFINAPVKPTDFFVDGVPCDTGVLDVIIPFGENDVFYHAIINNLDIINKYFDKREVLKNNKSKWFNLKYKTELVRNLCLLPWKTFSGFKNYHLPQSMLKSTFEKVYNLEQDRFINTYKNHFRGYEDITQYLIKYWQLAEGKFVPKKVNGKFFEIGPQTGQIVNAIRGNKYKMICLNDDSENIEFEKNKKMLISEFEKKYPEKSSFEK